MCDSTYLQARSALVSLSVKESNKLQSSTEEDQKSIMSTALKYSKLVIDSKEKVRFHLPSLHETFSADVAVILMHLYSCF